MTTYGILIVDTSWSNNDLTRVEKAAYLRHSDRLITGAHALIYVREPVDAVIAEAELTGDMIETETEPSSGLGTQEMAKTYLLPLKVTRRKGHTPLIPLSRLRVILGSDFSVYDENWIPLSADQYQQISTIWDKAKVS